MEQAVPEDELFTRDEILGGFPARRASALLFLIESKTAHMMAQSRQAMEIFLTEDGAKERELAFVEAFALGKDPPLKPTIQDLERYAPQWAPLVPDNPSVRAVIAHLVGQKYVFTYRAVSNVRIALTLDEEVVQHAYRRLYHEPVETIFAPRASLVSWLRWVWAGLTVYLESLSPFWTAFFLTLTETVGAGILALPIAVASVGPLAGVVLLIVLGLVNVLTIASMAEAISRSGTIRYGRAFIGQVAADFLGGIGSSIVTVGLATICLIGLLAYYIGFSTFLADATRVPAPIWTALLFFIVLYFLRRESLNATISLALVVGAINIGLILVLSLLSFTHLRLENLVFVNLPFLGGRSFDPSILQLIFGVVLSAYYGHMSLGNCARVVLRRDPSARSLIRGSAAATATVMVLYCVWVLAANGAIPAQSLVGQSGTALEPLARQVGPSVYGLGSVFVILGMGMASVHFSLGLFNLVRERLPARRQQIVVLPRGRGRLVLHRRGRPREESRLGLTYVGLKDDQPRFHLDVQWDGNTYYREIVVTDRWEVASVLDQLPRPGAHGMRLALEVLEASQQSVHVYVTSPMILAYEGEWDATGLYMTDLLVLPDHLRQLLSWIIRHKEVSLAEVMDQTGRDEKGARALLNTLMEQGFAREMTVEGEKRYRPQFGPRRARQLPDQIWQALGQERERPSGMNQLSPRRGVGVLIPWARKLLSSDAGRFMLSISPLAMIFLLVEWLLFTGRQSFPGPISLIGTIVVSLLGGIFPVLLLVSSRRKGEVVPGVVFQFMGHPLVVACIYLVFLGGIFLHGLVIWQIPFERAAALVVGVLILGATLVMVRRGSFAPRLSVELRQEETGTVNFEVTFAGRPRAAEVRLQYPKGETHCHAASGVISSFSSLQGAIFQLEGDQGRQLKVWAHRVTSEGESEALPVLLEVRSGGDTRRFDLKLSDGRVITPLSGEECGLKITLAEPSLA